MADDYSEEERNVFAKTISKVLSDQKDLESKLPLTHSDVFFFEELADGIILIYLLNKIDPNLIDMRTLNREHPLTPEK